VITKASKENPTFLIVHLVFKQHFTLSTQISKVKGFKYLICFLSIGFVVPTSLYEGYVTANLTRPYPAKKIENIEEALDGGFLILETILPALPKLIKNLFDNYRRLNKTVTHADKHGVKLAPGETTYIQMMLSNKLTGTSYIPRKAGRNVYDQIRFNDSRDNTEIELSTCNKSMILNEKDVLGETLTRLQQKHPQEYYIGEESLITLPKAFSMGPVHWDR